MTIKLHRDIYRRQGLAVVGMLLFTALFVGGNRFLGLAPKGELQLVTTFWAGIALLSYWSWSGRTRDYRDPGLTVLYILWATLFVSLSILISPQMRFVMMLAYLALLPFGILGMGWRSFFGVCLTTIGGYSLLVLYFRNHTEGVFDPRLELLLGASFALAAMSLALVAREMVLLREAYSRKSRELKLATARIEELSIKDEVTGLLNQRYFDRTLQNQRAVSNRDGRPFVVALMDLDHLDALRALHGERSVQTMMHELAQLLTVTLREVDIVSAYGAGRYGVLLTGATIDTGQAVLERIRQKVTETPFAKGVIQTSVSIGVVQYQPSESVEELLSRADMHAAIAVNEGGNRVVVNWSGSAGVSRSE